MSERKDKPTPGSADQEPEAPPPEPGTTPALPGTRPVPGEGVTDEQVQESGLDDEGDGG
jgi:hypothetical protein